MPAWLWPALSAIGSVAGDVVGIHESRRAASKTEDLSNTAVRRRVADLKAAGLNVGMAYDQQASTPTITSGADSSAGGRSVSNATSAAKLRSELELVKAQTDAQKASAAAQTAQAEKSGVEAENARWDLKLKSTGVEGSPSWMDEMLAARSARMRDLSFAGTLQPHQLKLAEADALLRGAQYRREGAGLSRAEFLSGVFQAPRNVMSWANEQYRRFPDAVEAAKAWNNAGTGLSVYQFELQKRLEETRRRMAARAREMEFRRVRPDR